MPNKTTRLAQMIPGYIGNADELIRLNDATLLINRRVRKWPYRGVAAWAVRDLADRGSLRAIVSKGYEDEEEAGECKKCELQAPSARR